MPRQSFKAPVSDAWRGVCGWLRDSQNSTKIYARMMW
jgi:hypothetical protein